MTATQAGSAPALQPARNRRHTLEVVAQIAISTLRGWTTSLGVPRAAVWPALASGYVLALASSLLAAAWLARSDMLAELTNPRIAVLLLVALVWVTSFTGIFAAAASAAATTGAVRFLRTLPVSDRALGAGLALPTLAAAGLQASFLAPATGLVVARGLGQPLAAGVGYALVANLLGTLQGRWLFGMARKRAMKRHSRGLPPQLLAVVGLAASVTVGELLLALQLDLSPPPAVALVTAPLGWPGLVCFAVRTDLPALLALGATLGFAVGVEWRAWPWLTAAVDDRPSGRRALGRWRARGTLPLVRLQLVRMVRHDRVRNVLGALLVLEALTTFIVLAVGPGIRAGIVDNSILLWCLTAASMTVLARGISARHRPFALTCGFPAYRWGTSVAVAGVALAAACVLPALLALAWAQRDPMLLAGGIGQLLYASVVGAILGAITTPNPGTGPAETIALAVVLAADLGLGNILDRFTPIPTAAGIGVVMGLVALPLAAIPGWIESWRWRRDIGIG